VCCPERNLEQSDVLAGDVGSGDGPAVDSQVRIGVGSASPLAIGGLRCRTNPERGSLLVDAASVLAELAARYPEVADEAIRQQAIDVLCLAQGNRVSVALMARLVEARIIALV
jgi:hypothetical protein